MTIFEQGCIPTKIEPNHIQASCGICGCIFDATEEEGILIVGIDKSHSYRQFYCPMCSARINVSLYMFDDEGE